ncbi:serine/threonine-protein phosphatase CPPED1-like isoform X2 [Zootermopsis nevadensis]|uniref:serine/threonine-protein phosphatase CPPED1-like isoform X2 n=1 Tax=Zootermopsis nevadensis TaxID=136037 RepID=UPI000B8ED3DA|nr:serine/threonine-protein phosphatase CPPED1-like isoform X2 [Zootermopsis nevadensis]
MSSRIVAKDHKIDCFKTADTKWKRPFYFVQGADLQMGMIQSYLEKNPVPGWKKEIELGERAVAIVNQMRPRPKFFVICGDLCDAFPDGQQEIRQKQEADFKKIFEKLDPEIPFICLSGNHDVGNRPTAKTINLYKSSFGDDYFSFLCDGVQFLALNSQYFEDASEVPDLAQEHEKWLNEELECAKQAGSRVIVFQHIPWFLNDPDEESNYFTIKPNIRKVWLEKFRNSDVFRHSRPS